MKNKPTKMNGTFGRKQFRYGLGFLSLLAGIHCISNADAALKVSIASGDWNNPAVWHPAGIPSASDDVKITCNHTVTYQNSEAKNLTIASGAALLGMPGKKLTIHGNLTVNGLADMQGGDINFAHAGNEFVIGQKAEFIWSPGNNTLPGASLFTSGIEKFHPEGKLTIKTWYDYGIPLGEVVSGNFGSLEINTPGGQNSIVEWNQKNTFSTQRVLGNLIIDKGWITLDKEGTITSVSFGKIILRSVNSTFIAHNGSHPSSFTVNIKSVHNNGGRFYGINDGNGNITMNIAGEFQNSGNVKIINNSGVSGVSNGNATFTVDGDYTQTSGDTRILYNVSTTTAGIIHATMKNLSLTGGIFMGHCAVHRDGKSNTIKIRNDLKVNYQNANDKFRGTGISSIGNILNNSALELVIGKNLEISGHTMAEFTGSASAGIERIAVGGDVIISGGYVNFNYGSASASHPTEISIAGELKVNGGSACLSRNEGYLNLSVFKPIDISSGQLILKGNNGGANALTGGLRQVGGELILHSNEQTATNDKILLTVNGPFYQGGGIINYDKNPNGIMHELSIRGESFHFTGSGKIFRSASGSANYGLLTYSRQGAINYSSDNGTHFIDQVIQEVRANCELRITDDIFRLSSSPAADFVAMRIKPQGRLAIQQSKIASNGLHPVCGLHIDSAGILALDNNGGLSGMENSALTNANISFDRNSIVEYNGAGQVITSSELTSSEIHQYGILRIDLPGNEEQIKLNSNIFIRSRLELIKGGLSLNEKILTVANGARDGIVRKEGYINCPIENNNGAGKIIWKNLTDGNHIIPYGNGREYLPMHFKPVSNPGSDLTISVHPIEKNTLPYPTNAGNAAPESTPHGLKIYNRWWQIDAGAMTADITISYSSHETVSGSKAYSPSALQWQGSQWLRVNSNRTKLGDNTNAIILKAVSNVSRIALASINGEELFEIKSFEASRKEKEVSITWETTKENAPALFSIEKSFDNINFSEIAFMQNNGGGENSRYDFPDYELTQGTVYYRLKISFNNNIEALSQVRIVRKDTVGKGGSGNISAVYPNPFQNTVNVSYQSDQNTLIEVWDMRGKAVLSIPVEASASGSNKLPLNLETLNKGIYLLSIKSNNQRESIKIVKNE